MNRDAGRDLPILTDVVELHATGSFPKPEAAPGQPGPPYASGLLTPEDIAALQAAMPKLRIDYINPPNATVAR